MQKVLVVDYGMGNLRSVVNAFKAIGQAVSVSSDVRDLKSADRIVLPGVGAFGDAMENLKSRGFVEELGKEVVEKEKPFLGLCLGLQLLATTSSEHGMHDGLNWIPGHVRKIEPNDPSIRIPHIGWNDTRFIKKCGLYAESGESKTFYFVHSYVFVPTDTAVVSGICNYGVDFTASVEKANISATQFHPEKSQKAGLDVLRNFLKWMP